jgi:hypothetical protein
VSADPCTAQAAGSRPLRSSGTAQAQHRHSTGTGTAQAQHRQQAALTPIRQAHAHSDHAATPRLPRLRLRLCLHLRGGLGGQALPQLLLDRLQLSQPACQPASG